AAFVANTKKKTIPMVVNAPVCSTSCTRSAIWAMFTVPTIAYKKAIVVTNIMDENKLISTYFKDSRNCFFSSPKQITTYEAISNTSKNTIKLNKSLYNKAPETPLIKRNTNV